MDNPFTKTNRAAVIIEHLGLQPGMTVLDAGCGPGRLTVPVAKQIGQQGSVVALDLQSGMLDRARQKAEAADLDNIQFLCAGLGERKLEQNRFDRALLVTVLGEIPDRESALQEIFAALKPGGVLSVTEVIFDPHFQSRGTVAKLAGAVGFRERESDVPNGQVIHAGLCVACVQIRGDSSLRDCRGLPAPDDQIALVVRDFATSL